MPTYEYRCTGGHSFELFQRMSDEPVAKCPTCAAPAERLLSAGAGFLFRGEGFYITDYRSENYRKAAAAEAAAAGGKTGGKTGGEGGSEAAAGAGSSSDSQTGDAPASTEPTARSGEPAAQSSKKSPKAAG